MLRYTIEEITIYFLRMMSCICFPPRLSGAIEQGSSVLEGE